jgi:hypothetical protein
MRGWIPPLPLALGAAAFGLSWIVLFAAAGSVSAGVTFLALAWVHVVALGWITLIALAILLHVIPAFLDVEWRSGGVARIATLCFAAGAAALVGGFLGAGSAALQGGAVLAFASLAVYVAAACEPVAAAIRRKGTVRAVARAFATTLAFALVTAALGTLFAFALAGAAPASALAQLPKSHAILGIAGWLSLLVVGVSARTLGAIAGERSHRIWAHVLSSSALLAGAIVAAVALAFDAEAAVLAGFGLLLIGVAVYAYDVANVLRHATVPHRPPQVLMACALLGALAATLLAVGAALGQPWGLAAVYVALLGWIGSAVLAHVHHIGIRVLLTNLHGEDDETRPEAVLTEPLTWATAVLYELAVVGGAAGLMRASPPLVSAAACAGFAAFALLLVNVVRAVSLNSILAHDRRS